MPPALPATSTSRLYFDYTSLQRAHTLIVRVPGTAITAELVAYAQGIANAMAQRMRENDSVFAVRFSAQGSNVSFPIGWTPVVGVLASTAATWDQDPESTFLSITGRGLLSGRKTRFSFYTPVTSANWPADNRYNPGDSAPVDTWRLNMVAALDGPPGGTIGAITVGGDFLSYNGYVNIAQNAYWQRKQRRGG